VASDPNLEHIRLMDSSPCHFGVRTCHDFKFFVARLHAIVDVEQMLDGWVLTPGSNPDSGVFPVLCDECVGLIYIGDKGYVSEDQENLVWERGKDL
jgi:hypothetical protein